MLAHPAAAGPSIGRLEALSAAGGLAYWSNDYPATRAAYVERLALAEAIGDDREKAEAHYDLAFVGVVERDIPLMRGEAEQAFAMHSALGDVAGIARSRQLLVLSHFIAGETDEALRLEEENLAAFQSTQSWYRVADSLMLISAIEWRAGRADIAIERARAALRSMPERVGGSTLGALGVLAVIQGEQGDAEVGAHLTGAILAIQEESGEALAPVTVLGLPHPRDVVVARLGSEEADRLMAEGRRLSVDEAIALALGEESVAPANA